MFLLSQKKNLKGTFNLRPENQTKATVISENSSHQTALFIPICPVARIEP